MFKIPSPLIKIENLRKYFPVRRRLLSRVRGHVHAVDSVDFGINPGESFGLAGESGCGKSTLARVVIGLLRPTSGRVYFEGRDVHNTLGDGSKDDKRNLRRNMQMVFQDTFSALNPRKTIKQILSEPFRIHENLKEDALHENVCELLEEVGLSPPKSFLERYAHEISGGQRQRVVLTRAIALNPKFIVADEPVSSLDMSVRAQILSTLMDLRRKLNLTLLMISHDLSLLRSMSDRLAIMYLGKMVEMAPAEKLFSNPLHPYTKALLAATPRPYPELARSKERIILKGDLPSPINPPSGCRFRTRCPYAFDKCLNDEPELFNIHGHHVACHLY